MAAKRVVPSHPVLDHRVLPKGRVAECIVLPTTQELLVGAVPRNIMPTALLRTRSGMVLMLRAVGHAWTDGRLSTVAQAMTRQSAPNAGLAALRQKLARLLDMPSLELPDCVWVAPRGDQWPVTALSEVALGSTDHGSTAGHGKGRRDGLHAALGAALDHFMTELDPRAASFALHDGLLDVAVYNYLAHRIHGRYRRQFARAFPLLAEQVVRHAGGMEDIAIRQAIDAGRPVVTEIARNWGVSPRVVRHLIGKTPEVVGEPWAGKLEELARILDALPPEVLPGDSPAHWEEFNAAASRAQLLAHEPLSNSVPALTVLREDLVGTTRKARDAARAEARGARLAVCVVAFRNALEFALEVELESAGFRRSRKSEAVAEAMVEDLMAALLRKGALAGIAWNFDQRKAQPDADECEERSLLAGNLYWPLLQDPFVSQDGTRKVISLERDEEIRELAGELRNCLWASSVYRDGSRQGSTTLLATVDPDTGRALSSAWVAVIRDRHRRRWIFNVIQHLAAGNVPPSEACRDALAEALTHCSEAGVQAHLERGAQLREARDQQGGRRAARRWEASHLVPALKEVLGGARYDALVKQAFSLLHPP